MDGVSDRWRQSDMRRNPSLGVNARPSADSGGVLVMVLVVIRG